MKGNSSLFKTVRPQRGFNFIIDLQRFAEKRVSDKGIAIQQQIDNQKLKNIVGELYREGATCDDGSAMAAASMQIKTGILVGGKDHIIKIKERIVNLTRVIETQNLSERDRSYALKLLDDMKRSLKGEY